MSNPIDTEKENCYNCGGDLKDGYLMMEVHGDPEPFCPLCTREACEREGLHCAADPIPVLSAVDITRTEDELESRRR
jgi:hypothetical protein